MRIPKAHTAQAVWAAFIIILALSATAAIGGESPASSSPKVILIIADYLSLPDLLDGPPPAIKRLVNEGGVGLLIPGTPGAGGASTYLTVGAGAFAWANSGVYKSYTGNEAVKDEADMAAAVYRRRTGQTRQPGVAHLEIPMLAQANEERMSISPPGALGDALSKAGKKTAVFGNSDFAEVTRRPAAAIAADGTGFVAFGDVSSRFLRREPFSPTGYVTDSARLASTVIESLYVADFIVVDFGDTARLELSKRAFSEESYRIHRSNAIRNLDSFLSRILKASGDGTTIILASLIPPIADPGEARRLGPVVVRSPRGPSGCLSSATTRTPGFVTGFDIAPTVLSSLDVPQPGTIIGDPIAIISGGREHTRKLDGIVIMNRAILWWALGTVAALGIVAVTAASVLVALGRRGRLTSAARFLLLAAMSGPIAMLFATEGEPSASAYAVRAVIWLAVVLVAAYAGSLLLRLILRERAEKARAVLPMVALAIIGSLVLFVDACMGGQLVRVSLPGAAGFKGFRFYGVGNEYMGIWIPMAMIAVVWMREFYPGWELRRAGKIVMLAVATAVVVGLGFPRFGANAGGTVTAVIGLGLVYWSGVRGKFSVWTALSLAAAGFALVVTVGLLDAVFSRNTASHIGRAASMTGSQGWDYISSLATRKVAMNFGLIGTVQSQTAIIGFVPFFALWNVKVGRKVKAHLSQSRAFYWGVMSAIPAAAAAFLFNDSGIVAGGLILGYVMMGTLFSLLIDDC